MISDAINGALVRLYSTIGSLKREEGQTLVEYSLIVALIAVVCVATLVLLGGKVNDALTSIKNGF